jgi:hypothetical protein
LIWPWEQGRDDHTLPRWHHWLLAAAILMLLIMAVPIFAAFS